MLNKLRSMITEKIKNVSNLLNNKINEIFIKNATADYIHNVIFDFNFKNTKIDYYFRSFKKFLINGVINVKAIKVYYLKNISLFKNNKMPENKFINLMSDVAFFLILNNKDADVVEMYNLISEKLKGVIYHRWKYYFAGKIIYFSILRDNLSSVISSGIFYSFNNEDLVEIIDELTKYDSYSFDKQMYNIHDLVWFMYFPNMFSIKNLFSTIKQDAIDEIIINTDLKHKNIRDKYLEYFEYAMIYIKDSITLLNILNRIISKRDMIYYYYSQENPKKIETVLKNSMSDSYFIYYVLVFSLLLKDNFYFDYVRFMSILRNYKMSNVDVFITSVVKEIPNFKKNYFYYKGLSNDNNK